MSKRVYYNRTDSPYTVTEEGHTLGGRERGEFEETEQIKRGVESGRLLDQGPVEEEQNNSEVTEQEPVNEEAKDEPAKVKSTRKQPKQRESQEN